MPIDWINFRTGQSVSAEDLNLMQDAMASHMQEHDHSSNPTDLSGTIQGPRIWGDFISQINKSNNFSYDLNSLNDSIRKHILDTEIHSVDSISGTIESFASGQNRMGFAVIKPNEWVWKGLYWEKEIQLPAGLYDDSSYVVYFQPYYPDDFSGFFKELNGKANFLTLEGVVPLNNNLLDFNVMAHSLTKNSFKVRMYAVGTGTRFGISSRSEDLFKFRNWYAERFVNATLNSPTQIQNIDNRLYVLSTGNNRIVIFDNTNGRIIEVISSPKTTAQMLSFGVCRYIDLSGTSQYAVTVTTTEGNFLMENGLWVDLNDGLGEFKLDTNVPYSGTPGGSFDGFIDNGVWSNPTNFYSSFGRLGNKVSGGRAINLARYNGEDVDFSVLSNEDPNLEDRKQLVYLKILNEGTANETRIPLFELYHKVHRADSNNPSVIVSGGTSLISDLTYFNYNQTNFTHGTATFDTFLGSSVNSEGSPLINSYYGSSITSWFNDTSDRAINLRGWMFTEDKLIGSSADLEFGNDGKDLYISGDYGRRMAQLDPSGQEFGPSFSSHRRLYGSAVDSTLAFGSFNSVELKQIIDSDPSTNSTIYADGSDYYLHVMGTKRLLLNERPISVSGFVMPRQVAYTDPNTLETTFTSTAFVFVLTTSKKPKEVIRAYRVRAVTDEDGVLRGKITEISDVCNLGTIFRGGRYLIYPETEDESKFLYTALPDDMYGVPAWEIRRNHASSPLAEDFTTYGIVDGDLIRFKDKSQIGIPIFQNKRVIAVFPKRNSGNPANDQPFIHVEAPDINLSTGNWIFDIVRKVNTGMLDVFDNPSVFDFDVSLALYKDVVKEIDDAGKQTLRIRLEHRPVFYLSDRKNNCVYTYRSVVGFNPSVSAYADNYTSVFSSWILDKDSTPLGKYVSELSMYGTQAAYYGDYEIFPMNLFSQEGTLGITSGVSTNTDSDPDYPNVSYLQDDTKDFLNIYNIQIGDQVVHFGDGSLTPVVVKVLDIPASNILHTEELPSGFTWDNTDPMEAKYAIQRPLGTILADPYQKMYPARQGYNYWQGEMSRNARYSILGTGLIENTDHNVGLSPEAVNPIRKMGFLCYTKPALYTDQTSVGSSFTFDPRYVNQIYVSSYNPLKEQDSTYNRYIAYTPNVINNSYILRTEENKLNTYANTFLLLNDSSIDYIDFYYDLSKPGVFLTKNSNNQLEMVYVDNLKDMGVIDQPGGEAIETWQEQKLINGEIVVTGDIHNLAKEKIISSLRKENSSTLYTEWFNKNVSPKNFQLSAIVPITLGQSDGLTQGNNWITANYKGAYTGFLSVTQVGGGVTTGGISYNEGYWFDPIDEPGNMIFVNDDYEEDINGKILRVRVKLTQDFKDLIAKASDISGIEPGTTVPFTPYYNWGSIIFNKKFGDLVSRVDLDSFTGGAILNPPQNQELNEVPAQYCNMISTGYGRDLDEKLYKFSSTVQLYDYPLSKGGLWVSITGAPLRIYPRYLSRYVFENQSDENSWNGTMLGPYPPNYFAALNSSDAFDSVPVVYNNGKARYFAIRDFNYYKVLRRIQFGRNSE